MLLGEQCYSLGQPQLGERRDSTRDHAEREGDRSALAEDVDAKAGQAGRREGQVELAGRVECGAARGILRGDCREHAFELWLVERRPVVERDEGAIVPEDRRLADLQVNVAGAGLNCMQEQGLQVHLSVIGSRDARLERADAMTRRLDGGDAVPSRA